MLKICLEIGLYESRENHYVSFQPTAKNYYYVPQDYSKRVQVSLGVVNKLSEFAHHQLSVAVSPHVTYSQ